MSNKRPTEKQKRVAQAIVDNVSLTEPKTGGEILENIGYGPGMVKNPQMVLDSEGVLKALEDLGFNEENAKRVVGEILNKGREENRLKAADMVFKVHSTYAPEKSVNVQVNIDIEQQEKINKAIDEII